MARPCPGSYEGFVHAVRTSATGTLLSRHDVRLRPSYVPPSGIPAAAFVRRSTTHLLQKSVTAWRRHHATMMKSLHHIYGCMVITVMTRSYKTATHAKRTVKNIYIIFSQNRNG